MIIVTGATGHYGKAAIDFLLKKLQPGEVAALVRDPKKAEYLAEKKISVRRGDYNDYDSLVTAFERVEKVLFVSSSDLEDRVGQHRNVINAAKQAGVQHIVYTSSPQKTEEPYFRPGLDHKETEKLLQDSGIAYTILRNSFYFETLPMMIGDALQTGKIFYPAGDGELSDASRGEMAEAAANVLTSSGHENKIYEIGSNDSFSLRDVADALGELSGKKVEYVDIPLEAMKAELEKNQTPAETIGIISGIANAVKYNELNNPSPDLERLLGRKLIALREFLKQTYFSESSAAA